jgi:hypothetical protein
MMPFVTLAQKRVLDEMRGDFRKVPVNRAISAQLPSQLQTV